MSQSTGFNLPPPQEPFVDPRTGILSNSGYQYLLSLLDAAATDQSTSTVSTGLKSTGTNQATALQLSAQWNEVDTVPAGTGVILSEYQPGQSQTVFDGDPANALLVYPPPGFKIDSLGLNEPFSLAHGSKISFETWPENQIRS